MSVLLDTSAGEIVIDIYPDQKDSPNTSLNFLKLCKLKYYNNCLFFNIQPNLIAQTGDPTGTGDGGNSVFGILRKEKNKCFSDEIPPPPLTRKFNKIGVVAMANSGPNTNRSQFFISLRAEDMSHFDGKYTIFGEVAEGLEVLEKLNNLYCDEDGRPFQDVRIRHTYILDDPFPDPPGAQFPSSSPLRQRPEDESVSRRIPYEDGLVESADGRTEEGLLRHPPHPRIDAGLSVCLHYACLHTSVYPCMHAYVHTYIHMYACIRVHMYTCIQACMHVAHVYIHEKSPSINSSINLTCVSSS